METFGIRDLRERSGDLTRTAESGQMALITHYPADGCIVQANIIINLGKAIATRLVSRNNSRFSFLDRAEQGY